MSGPFNTGSDLLVITPVERLRVLFAKYVAEASEFDLSRRASRVTSTRNLTLARFLERRLETLDEMTVRDFVVAFRIFRAYPRESRDEATLKDVREALCLDRERITGIIIAQRWLKYVFSRLWNDGAVLFPLHFRFGSSLVTKESVSFLPRLATCNLDTLDGTVSCIGLAVILASRWRDFSDIDLDDYARLIRTICDDVRKLDEIGMRRRHPQRPFTQALRVWARIGRSEGFRYSASDIEIYRYWIVRLREGATDMSFLDFSRNSAERRRNSALEAHARSERRTAAAQLTLYEGADQDEHVQAVIEGQKSVMGIRLEMMASNVASPSDVLDYVRLLRTKGFRHDSRMRYPGRMHAVPTDLWVVWNNVFEEFFAYRSRRGYEESAGWHSLRYVYQDYLCCYLPWWRDLVPDLPFAVPVDPSEFNRSSHWTGYAEDGAPLSLLRFFDQTRGGQSLAHYTWFVSASKMFFDYCRSEAPRLRLSTPGFINPVVRQLDQKVNRRPQKTNKNPIATSVLPYLLRYAYACEAFFETLAQQSLEGTLGRERRKALGSAVRNANPFDTKALGVDVGFDFEGARYVIDSVPHLAPMEDRFVRLPGKEAAMVYLPHLSGLRMNIAALEIGIRFQGIQWLCRKTYRSRVAEGMDDAELVPLVVNTDKVRDRPWTTLVVRRVYEMLLREERYQDLMADAQVERLVQYERRPSTRFDPVLPLFRGPQSEYPAGDKSYATVWERLLIGFSLWYRAAVKGAAPLDMFGYEPEIEPQTKAPRVLVLVDGEDRRQYCPLKVKLKHTPHAARATFISARSGILPIEITGWLVGHTNKTTTYYYTVESEADLSARLLAASEGIWSPDRSNPVDIRADEVNSALRRSFKSDRAGTEIAFGMQTLSLLNDDAPDIDGVTLLRSTPMGHVAFRETHICPVGEVCPANVMDVIVEPRRCGVCPLAVKSVDHLPSIAAKMRHLLEQAREGSRLVDRMRARSEPEKTIEEVRYRRRLNVMEYEGWRSSLLALTRSLAELGEASADLFHTGMPDAVRLHLKLVTCDAGQAEFVMRRICDSDAHAAFETPTVRAQATQLRQRLLAKPEALDNEIGLYDDDPVRSFVSGLRLLLEAHGIAPTFQAALEAVRKSLAPPRGAARPALPKPREA
ncbi:hypothetical protein [Methylobacterium phyllostachyos]|uniref:hypothetical protein n=1 Tax=Methylobacterium phyllostachyos TaxID=582672 RepID=UPI00116002A4|nr:hypothetical protein [Methylobacterium phyllostachyos]